jgi:hypothetical protein
LVGARKRRGVARAMPAIDAGFAWTRSAIAPRAGLQADRGGARGGGRQARVGAGGGGLLRSRGEAAAVGGSVVRVVLSPSSAEPGTQWSQCSSSFAPATSSGDGQGVSRSAAAEQNAPSGADDGCCARHRPGASSCSASASAASHEGQPRAAERGTGRLVTQDSINGATWRSSQARSSGAAPVDSSPRSRPARSMTKVVGRRPMRP